MKKHNLKILILIALFIILLFIGILFFKYVDYFDKIILDFIRNNLTYSILTKIMNIVSIILTPIPMLAIFIFLYVIMKNKYSAFFICTSTFSALLVNIIFKNIFRRDRPFEYMIGNASGYSFPSAHSMVCIAFYGSIIYCVNNCIKDKVLKTVLNTIFFILVILTPISRVYLGVHNFTDILMGILIGYIIMEICKYICDKANNKE